MRRYAGRYNHLHGGGCRVLRPEREQVIAAGAMPAIVQALAERRRGRRRNVCNICGGNPCESPSACRAQARYEDGPGDAGDYMEMDKEIDNGI